MFSGYFKDIIDHGGEPSMQMTRIMVNDTLSIDPTYEDGATLWVATPYMEANAYGLDDLDDPNGPDDSQSR